MDNERGEIANHFDFFLLNQLVRPGKINGLSILTEGPTGLARHAAVHAAALAVAKAGQCGLVRHFVCDALAQALVAVLSFGWLFGREGGERAARGTTLTSSQSIQ